MAQTGRMRIALRLVLDCPPEVAWDRLHAPSGMKYAMAPFLRVAAVGGTRLPDRWTEGEHYTVRVRLFGVVPLGEQRVELSSEIRGPIRILTDSGGPVSGALGVIEGWRHRMAVSSAPGGATLYRDRLDIRGAWAVAAWPVLWVLWQYRGKRIQRFLARPEA